ncbi:hypothetical protein [Novosphingobium sp. ZW T3_23]
MNAIACNSLENVFPAVLGGISALGDTLHLHFAQAMEKPFRILKAAP